MKNYTSLTRIDTSNLTESPNGVPKNASSETSNDGTLIDKNFIADWYETFWKCVRVSGITPNDSFDNVSNGYQLYQAMFLSEFVDMATFYNSFTSVSDDDYDKLQARKEVSGNIVRISGWITQGASASGLKEIFLLPTGYRPNKLVIDKVRGYGENQTDEILYIHPSGVCQIIYNFGESGSKGYINVTFPLGKN